MRLLILSSCFGFLLAASSFAVEPSTHDGKATPGIEAANGAPRPLAAPDESAKGISGEKSASSGAGSTTADRSPASTEAEANPEVSLSSFMDLTGRRDPSEVGEKKPLPDSYVFPQTEPKRQ